MKNSNDIKYDMDIDLKDVLGQTVKLFKHLLFCSVIISLLLGGYKFVVSYNLYKSNEVSQSVALENKNAIKDKEQEISTIKYQLDKQTDYLKNSVYINIDPLQEQKGVISYYISTPQTGMEFDYAKNVVHAYKNLFNSGKVANYVKNNLSYDIEVEYLYELISVNDDINKSNNYVDITIVHSNEKELEEIMSLVQKYVEDNQGVIVKQVGNHNLSLVSNSIVVVKDDNIIAKRKELDTTIKSLETDLSTKEFELDSMQTDKMTLNKLARETINYIIVGFVAGLFVCFILVAGYISLSNKIISANQLRNSMCLPVLGDFVQKKKKLSKIERLGYKLVGEDVTAEFEDSLKVAAYNMVSLTDKKDVILLDLVENDLSTEILDKIVQYDFAKEITFAKGGKTFEQFDLLEKLKDTTGVVIIAKKMGTKIPRLEREISIANDYGSELVGILLV